MFEKLKATESKLTLVRPADITAAEQLRDEVLAFNSGAESRDRIDAAANAGIERIKVAAAAFRSSRDGTFADRDGLDSRVREDGRSILDAVSAYLALVTGSVRDGAAGVGDDIEAALASQGSGQVGTITIANVELQSGRVRIKRGGEAIVSALNSYVAERTTNERVRASRIQNADETLERARRMPLLGEALRILEALLDEIDRHPNDIAYGHAANAAVPLLAELLGLPGAGSTLHTTAQDLIETLRRHRTPTNVA